MKDSRISLHLWRAIEAQAKTVADSIEKPECSIYETTSVERVTEMELKRLRILMAQLEE
ncbi:hypothetical protein [Vibrio albus]|uniref:hypothetical protein n=1 Tax=Vibrio albus TaxID=2200953 RepID=UPI0015E83A3E|nr:hypothetical protein [Vibrio albus]